MVKLKYIFFEKTPPNYYTNGKPKILIMFCVWPARHYCPVLEPKLRNLFFCEYLQIIVRLVIGVLNFFFFINRWPLNLCVTDAPNIEYFVWERSASLSWIIPYFSKIFEIFHPNFANSLNFSDIYVQNLVQNCWIYSI